ncbi:hypothetical protein [Flavivirga eckloniae]|uniref:Uncharacterized protein n=1 Tax=Flavivirga eckloniae TaxID=1803846 RepID=A0A2K9PT23_9FLAO|nr:hypothetical protein [Flavivirga eckloniae]AUP79697.1 hypothetical protein C1H87_13660 [Flavivirga eckloniae]
MNNKVKTYVLLASVLAIWGIIGLKILSTLNPDAPNTVFQNDIVAFKPKTNIEVDTFSIQSMERDPFLGTLYLKKKPKKKKSVKPKDTLVWVPIIYHGAITKQQSKTQVFVVSINGRQNLMRIGQEVDHVKLIKANAKEIRVSYKGARKTITKI